MDPPTEKGVKKIVIRNWKKGGGRERSREREESSVCRERSGEGNGENFDKSLNI